MEIRGKIKKISATVQYSDRFRKREFVLEYAENPEYPQPLQFEFVQDRCELLDQFQEGQEVEINFDLRGREWTNPQGEVRYFNSLQAWKILDAKDAANASKANTNSPARDNRPPASATPPLGEKPGWLENEASDDLPF